MKWFDGSIITNKDKEINPDLVWVIEQYYHFKKYLDKHNIEYYENDSYGSYYITFYFKGFKIKTRFSTHSKTSKYHNQPIFNINYNEYYGDDAWKIIIKELKKSKIIILKNDDYDKNIDEPDDEYLKFLKINGKYIEKKSLEDFSFYFKNVELKNEQLFEKKFYIGSCINSFDEDGYCTLNELPWETVSDLAYTVENSIKIDKDTFFKNVEVPDELLKSLKNHTINYLQYEYIYIMYDEYNDIHYFFI